MTFRLNTESPDFNNQFTDFLTVRSAEDADISQQVRTILDAVKTRGDDALVEYTRKWDWQDFSHSHIRITDKEIRKAQKDCAPEVKDALKLAASRIRTYHRKQKPKDVAYTDKQGVQLGWRWSSIDAVGLYVPGGKASYPSSVLMNAVPAKVAGCSRLVMVVPTPGGEINSAVLVAAKLAGVDEIYRVGGAQAVAALAFGTASIAAVDKIVGPGNSWVAEAKRQVFGTVGIDMIAGPSEICVMADSKNNPEWIAADLLSQAEHDAMAQSVLITDDEAFARAVEAAVEAQLKTLPREAIARASWEKWGAIILSSSWQKAVDAINRLAPEHLELAVEDPQGLLPHIKHAGAVFLGRYTPEAIGDYIAGPSHVLPTSRTARFSSVLSVTDFMKRSSVIGCDSVSFAALAPAGSALADSEGLGAHALSMRVRLK